MSDTMTPQLSRRAAICSLGSSLGLMLIAVATLLPLLQGSFGGSPLYRWLFAGGAVVCLVCTLFNPAPKDWPLQRRRWARIEGWSSIFFCVAAVFLFLPGSSPRDWLAFTLAGAVIRIICFFRSFRPFK